MSLLIPKIADKRDYNGYLLGNKKNKRKTDTKKFKTLKAQGKTYSKRLKRTATPSEKVFKGILKELKINYLFQHTAVVNNRLYILDFFIPNSTLVVEVDGSSHDEVENYIKDIRRQQSLEDNGYKVIRFTNNEVMNNTSEYFKNKLRLRY